MKHMDIYNTELGSSPKVCIMTYNHKNLLFIQVTFYLIVISSVCTCNLIICNIMYYCMDKYTK